MNRPTHTLIAALIFLLFACPVIASNHETIQTTSAYPGQQDVSVAVYCHNEIGLFEYFNLIVFDDTRLEFVSMTPDRGEFWYGNYPTQVVGNKIYIHGWAGGFSDCLDPETSEPGSPLLHLDFHVRSDAPAGLATIDFSSEAVFDGHWVDCSYMGVNPPPGYYDGGIEIEGYSNHITIGDHQADESGHGIVQVRMQNDHDVFEYFNQILFDSSVAQVDSMVAMRGVLHYGYYPTHVSGDTIFVHGWASSDVCFEPDSSPPGATLYQIHFSAVEGATSEILMDLVYLDPGLLWNHWVGCNMTTTDSFSGTDGSLYFPEPIVCSVTGSAYQARLLGNYPNPFNPVTTIGFDLPRAAVVNLRVFDLNGRLVRALLTQRQMTVGVHEVVWNGKDDSGQVCATGVYFYRLETGDIAQAQRMVLLK